MPDAQKHVLVYQWVSDTISIPPECNPNVQAQLEMMHGQRLLHLMMGYNAMLQSVIRGICQGQGMPPDAVTMEFAPPAVQFTEEGMHGKLSFIVTCPGHLQKTFRHHIDQTLESLQHAAGHQ